MKQLWFTKITVQESKPNRFVPSKVYQQRNPNGVTAATVENDLVPTTICA